MSKKKHADSTSVDPVSQKAQELCGKCDPIALRGVLEYLSHTKAWGHVPTLVAMQRIIGSPTADSYQGCLGLERNSQNIFMPVGERSMDRGRAVELAIAELLGGGEICIAGQNSQHTDNYAITDLGERVLEKLRAMPHTVRDDLSEERQKAHAADLRRAALEQTPVSFAAVESAMAGAELTPEQQNRFLKIILQETGLSVRPNQTPDR
ncbi:MAG: hypothetical protein SFX19_08090 [Alphaproteobacteria bacterium]|nr:hypothetical protein [Alphaproteobacteria bacterium]